MATSKIKTQASAIAVATAVVAFMLYLLDVSISMWSIVVIAIWMTVLGAVARRSADVELGFILVGVAGLLVLFDWFAPAFLVDAMSPLHQLWVSMTGIDLGAIDATTWAVLLVVFTFVMIYMRVRLSGKKKFADTAADLTLNILMVYVRRYSKILRLAVFFIFGIVVMVLSQFGDLIGEAGQVIASVPLVASNIVTAFAGYAALGGDVPVIENVPIVGDLTAIEMLVFGIVVLVVAAAVRWESSGPLSRSLRDR